MCRKFVPNGVYEKVPGRKRAAPRLASMLMLRSVYDEMRREQCLRPYRRVRRRHRNRRVWDVHEVELLRRDGQRRS